MNEGEVKLASCWLVFHQRAEQSTTTDWYRSARCTHAGARSTDFIAG